MPRRHFHCRWGKRARVFLMPSLTCPFCMCAALVIYIHMYRASVRAPAVKICYGYSFLNVHTIRLRETRIMGVRCIRVMCLSQHVMKHMVHLCVYKQVSYLWQAAFLFSHLCGDVFEARMLVCICGPSTQAFTRRSRDAEMRCTSSQGCLVWHSSISTVLVHFYTILSGLHVLWSLCTVYFMSMCPVLCAHLFVI